MPASTSNTGERTAAIAPSSRGCPIRRRSRSSGTCGRAAAIRSRSGRRLPGSTGRRAARIPRIPSRRNRIRPAVVQPRLPRAGGAAAEVRCHVLDHQRRDQLGTLGGQTPRVQPAHRMPDQPGRRAQRGHRVTEVGDESFGADRVRIGDVAAAVPWRVVGVDRTQPGQPRQLPRPGAAPAHQAVHQDHRLASSTTMGQQIGGHAPILRGRAGQRWRAR